MIFNIRTIIRKVNDGSCFMLLALSVRRQFMSKHIFVHDERGTIL